MTPIPVARGLGRASAAARLLGLWVRIPPGHGCLSHVSVVCCQVDVSASGWLLVQRSPTECGVSECDHETSTMRWPWPTGGFLHHGKRKKWRMISRIAHDIKLDWFEDWITFPGIPLRYSKHLTQSSYFSVFESTCLQWEFNGFHHCRKFHVHI